MTTVPMAENPASERQISFLQDLIASRDIEPSMAEKYAAIIATPEHLERVDASRMIDALVGLPKIKKVRDTSAKSETQELLSKIPKSKYAVPTVELELAGVDESFRGGLAFFELKEYMGTLYMRQLHGSPGRFNRSKMKLTSVEVVAQIIMSNPYEYAKMFGDHYTCCGSCGAPLTDEKSRELMLGPECRKKFGF